MMVHLDIKAIYRDMESDLVERKRSAQDADRIREAICAFANDLPDYRAPGVIFIGQEDNGSCANVPIDDDLLRRLSSFKDDGKLLPFPSIEVRRETIDGCVVAVIIVHPSDNPPIRLDNRVWIRVGPRRDLATPEEERKLVEKRKWGNLPHDAQGVPGAALDDLDQVRFELERRVVDGGHQSFGRRLYARPDAA